MLPIQQLQLHTSPNGAQVLRRQEPARNGGASMTSPKTIGSFAIVLAGAFAMITVGCISSDARARKAPVTKASTLPIQSQQPEEPIKMRYYGGPKSPMYPG
jgi:hypothetical protein